MLFFIRPNVIAKGKRCYYSSQLVSYLSASSVSVSTSYLSSMSSSSSSTSTSTSSLYFSSSSTSIVYDSNNGDSDITVRSRFKEIPVHQSILQYIKRVGVGRNIRRDNRRRKKRPFDKNKNSKNTDNNNTMSRDEEESYLEGREFLSRRRTGNTTYVNTISNDRDPQKGGKLPRFLSSSSPPPFGDPRRELVTKQRREDTLENNFMSSNDETTAIIARSIRILPVKLLGHMTASSENDSNNGSPRPTSGLPEIAIIGRSNVGKSTLLNALLYGGRSIKKDGDKGEETVYKRRRAAQSAKLHRGVKAKTSSKPGETQSIDFYQLSAQIIEGPSDGDNYDDKKGNANKSNLLGQRKKISLLLVDAPGYGFAYGPKKERNKTLGSNVDDEGNSTEMEFLFPWQSLIETYIIDRPRSSLKRVLLLIDARHGMKQADINFLASLQSALMVRQKQYRDNVTHGGESNIRGYAKDINTDKRRIEPASIDSTLNEKKSSIARLPPVPTELPPLQIVLTKCDLVSQSDLARRVVQVRKQLSDSLIRQPKILPEMLVSAQMEGQLGVIELQKELASLCGDRWT